MKRTLLATVVLWCGPGCAGAKGEASRTRVDGEERPERSASGVGPMPEPEPAPHCELEPEPQPEPEEPGLGDPGTIRHGQGGGGSSGCRYDHPDWQVRAGATARLPDGSVHCALRETAFVRCRRASVSAGRGCFDGADVEGLVSDAERLCFDEADVLQLYGEYRQGPMLEVSVGDPVSDGPHPAHVVALPLHDAENRIRLCIERDLERSIDLDDTVRVTYTIVGRDRETHDLTVRSRTLSAAARDCIANVVGGRGQAPLHVDGSTHVTILVDIRTFFPEARERPAPGP